MDLDGRRQLASRSIRSVTIRASAHCRSHRPGSGSRLCFVTARNRSQPAASAAAIRNRFKVCSIFGELRYWEQRIFPILDSKCILFLTQGSVKGNLECGANSPCRLVIGMFLALASSCIGLLPQSVFKAMDAHGKCLRYGRLDPDRGRRIVVERSGMEDR